MPDRVTITLVLAEAAGEDHLRHRSSRYDEVLSAAMTRWRASRGPLRVVVGHSKAAVPDSASLRPCTNPLRGRARRARSDAFRGSGERLSGPGSGFEHEGSPFSLRGDPMLMQPISQPISPLRQRMLEDMAMRGLREETQRDYVRFVRSFAAFLRRPPDTATARISGASRSTRPRAACSRRPSIARCRRCASSSP